jgi:hypothetical protein
METEFPVHVLYECAFKYLQSREDVSRMCMDVWRRTFLSLDTELLDVACIVPVLLKALDSKNSSCRRVGAQCLALVAKRVDKSTVEAYVKQDEECGTIKWNLIERMINCQ